LPICKLRVNVKINCGRKDIMLYHELFEDKVIYIVIDKYDLSFSFT